MQEHEYTVGAAVGLHARPAAMLVRTAAKFASKITIRHGEKQVNAKSLLSVLSLGAEHGSRVTVSVDGSDEGPASDAISALFSSDFGEPA